ncbi:hypothetical protein [Azospirillum cavernae]|uniref:hypothetical protein n=1 Tax=Azospirillum cavernae TaxID=2320860 RepID=UPI0011C36F16|nr:hypothetical protein [Azospirillum cavernae]
MSSKGLSVDEVEFLKGRIEKYRLPPPDAHDIEKALHVLSLSSVTLDNGLIARLVVNKGGHSETIDLAFDPLVVREMIGILKNSGLELGWLDAKGEVRVAKPKKVGQPRS